MEKENYQQMGSLNHSIAQARLTSLLSNDKRFTVMPVIESISVYFGKRPSLFTSHLF